MELSDKVELTLGAIDREQYEQYEQTVAACRTYAEKLAEGGKPVVTFGSAFRAASPHATRINNAHREAQGLEPIPYSPGTPAYRVFEYLLAREGELVPWQTIIDALHMGRFYPDTYLKRFALEQVGWSLVKGKVDGKSAYGLMRVEAGVPEGAVAV